MVQLNVRLWHLKQLVPTLNVSKQISKAKFGLFSGSYRLCFHSGSQIKCFSSLHSSSLGLGLVNYPSSMSALLSNVRAYHTGQSEGTFIFRQLLEYKSYTYTYLLADAKTKEAILVDPVIETVDRDFRLVQDLGLKLIGGANTHVHADHITGTGELKKREPGCKSMIAAVSNAKADVKLKAGDKIPFGQFSLEVRETPGHTNGCLSFVCHETKMVFTGDALLIKGCGRTDFQEGNSETLYDSVHKQIFTLPDDYIVLPAHDYTGQTMSTVGEEKQSNPRLRKSKSEFVKVMNALNLPYPKQIDKALPANMVCGIFGEV